MISQIILGGGLLKLKIFILIQRISSFVAYWVIQYSFLVIFRLMCFPTNIFYQQSGQLKNSFLFFFTILALFGDDNLHYDQLFTFMLFGETPYEFIQRKDRQRKMIIMNNIERKDLKRKSLSYNFKLNEGSALENVHPQQRATGKDAHNTIAVNQTIKKSYYYRKLLNRSIDCHMTTDDFQRVKQKFDKIQHRQSAHDNKTSLFRQIWQKEHNKRITYSQENNQQNYLELVTKKTQKEQEIDQQPEEFIRYKQKFKPKSIIDIAQQRKNSLNFDLQITGNKKSIRIKQASTSKSKIQSKNTISSTPNDSEGDLEINHPTIIIDNDTTMDNKHQCSSKSKKICCLYKKVQEERKEKTNQNGNQFLKIKKIDQPYFPFSSPKDGLIGIRYKQMMLRQVNSEIEPPNRQFTSYSTVTRPNTTYSLEKFRADGLKQNQQTRFLSHKKQTKLPNFINDIKGWNFGQQNDQQLI